MFSQKECNFKSVLSSEFANYSDRIRREYVIKTRFSGCFEFDLNVFGFRTNVASLEEVLNSAERQTANYQETFRNLLAIETKIFEEFNNEGETRKESTVEANFLVYQSSRNPRIAYEFRNILRVMEKPFPIVRLMPINFCRTCQNYNS